MNIFLKIGVVVIFSLLTIGIAREVVISFNGIPRGERAYFNLPECNAVGIGDSKYAFYGLPDGKDECVIKRRMR